MSDGRYTKTSPTYRTEDVPAAFDEIKENFEVIEIMEYLNGLLIYSGNHCPHGYDGNGNLTTKTIKNSSETVLATITYAYNGSGDCTSKVISIGSKTWTYTYTYSAGDLSDKSLAIT